MNPRKTVVTYYLNSVAALCIFSCSQLDAQFTYFESFTDTTAPGWTFQQRDTNPGPRLTANASPDSADPEFGSPQIDTVGNGWLRLASDTGNQDNAVTLNVDIPSSANEITIEFDFTMWNDGTNNADGISVFLYDADVAFNTGANGGSLSYAQKSGTTGLNGAYVGVGLDVWGNFSNATEGRTGSDPTLDDDLASENPGFIPNQVVVRGPDDSVAQDGSGNYYVLGGTGSKNYTLVGDPTIAALDATEGAGGSNENLSFSNQLFRPDQDALDYRGFKLTLDDLDQLTVSIEFGEGSGYTDLYTVDLSTFTRPENLRIGFGAATGGAMQVHEIRNLSITTSGSDNTFYWADAAPADDNLWETAANWDPASLPTDHADVVFSDSSDYTGLDSDDTITVGGIDKTLGSLFFSGQYGYTLTPDTNQIFILDTDGNGGSEINVLNNANGNADHTVALNISVENNDLKINNLVDQTLTLSGDIDSNGNNIEIDTTGTTILSGVISEGASITTRGDGTTTLSGTNTYTGTTTVENGILLIANNNALGDSGADTIVQNGGSLGLTGNITTNADEAITIAGSGEGGVGAIYNFSGTNIIGGDVDLTDDATVGIESGILIFNTGSVIDGAGFDLTFNTPTGALLGVFDEITDSSGTTNVTYDGGGSSFVLGASTYSGTTTINDGIVQIRNTNALGSTANGTTVNSGASLDLFGSIAIAAGEDLTLSGDGGTTLAALNSSSGSNTWNGDITLASDASVGAGLASTLTLTGNITGGSNGLTKEGDGTVILSGNNTYTGTTTIEAGTLQLGASDRISNSSAVVLNDTAGATLDLNNNNETIGSLAGGGSNGGNVSLGSGDLTTGGDNSNTTFSGILSGTGDLIKEGTGTLTLNGANTATGNFQINSGILEITADNTLADDADVTLNGGTLAIAGVVDTIDNFTLSANSTIDYQSTVGGYLTVDTVLAPTGTLTVDNWIGSLNGNGDTRFTVTEAALTANMTSLATNTSFSGFGTSSTWVDLGGGLFELVPDFSGFIEWDGSEDPDDSWDTGANWVGGVAPNSTSARVLIGDLDSNLDGKTIDFPAGRRQIRDLVIDNDATFTISDASGGSDRLGWNEPGNNDTYLTVIGGASPTFDTEIFFWDIMNIVNNSTGTLTFDGDLWIRDESFATISELRFTGSGDTVVNGSIFDNTSNKGQVTFDGSGTWTLNANNTFSNGLILNNGTIKVGNNGALGDGSITINGGILEATEAARTVDETYTINNSFTVGNDDGNDHDLAFTGNGTLSAGNQTITVEDDVTFNINGDLTGSGTLIKAGNGTLDINGNDTDFTGDLIINAGTVSTSAADQLVIGADSAGNNYLGAGDITVNSGGTLTATMTGGNDITLASGGTLNNTGGTITLTNTNSAADFQHQGTLDIDDGNTTIDIGGQYLMSSGSTLDVSTGTLNINADNQFLTQGTSATPATLSVSNSGTVNVDISSGTNVDFTLDQDDTLTVDGSGTNFNITGDAASDVLLNGTVLLSDGGQLTVLQGNTTLDTTTILNGGSATTKGTLEVRGDLNIQTPQLANAPNITINNSTATQIAAVSGTQSIENIGTLTKTGTGTTTIATSVNNIQAGLIDVQAGTLLNATNDQIENNTGMRLAGGTWDTGGFDEVLGTLTLSDDSVIDLNNGDSVIEFDDSSGETWDTSKYVFIDNWSGDYINGGGTDQLIFNSAGLTNDQLSRVVFRNPVGTGAGLYGAQFIGNELVPIVPVPEPGTLIMGTLTLAALICFERRRRSAKTAT